MDITQTPIFSKAALPSGCGCDVKIGTVVLASVPIFCGENISLISKSSYFGFLVEILEIID